MRATFKGGYTLSFYKADIATGDAEETWHNQPNDSLVSNVTNPHLAGDLVIFPFAAFGGRGGGGGGRGGQGRGGAAAATPATPDNPPAVVDEWDRYYALNVADAAAR